MKPKIKIKIDICKYTNVFKTKQSGNNSVIIAVFMFTSITGHGSIADIYNYILSQLCVPFAFSKQLRWSWFLTWYGDKNFISKGPGPNWIKL